MNNIEASQPEGVADLKLANHVQLLLADQYYGHSSEETQIKWIEKYSKRFREIITEHPELLDQFEKNPVKSLEDIKSLLYQE